jgi:hypothetical protein
MSAISTRDPDPYYNRVALPHLHRGLCSFLMSCGAAARTVNPCVATLWGNREERRPFSRCEKNRTIAASLAFLSRHPANASDVVREGPLLRVVNSFSLV